MYCQNCGKEIIKESRFCKFCGKSVSTSTEALPQPTVDKKPEKLDGWLVIVIIGLFISILLRGYYAYDTMLVLNSENVHVLNDPSSASYIPNYANFLTVEMIAQIVFAAAVGYLIYLFFKRSQKFPKYFIWLLIISFVWTVLGYFFVASLSSSIPGEIKAGFDKILTASSGEIIQTLAAGLIWGTYILKSKKVKAVFVEK